jgi:hypothetical protein
MEPDGCTVVVEVRATALFEGLGGGVEEAHACEVVVCLSQSLKKTFITTDLTAVKKNKEPTHTPGGPGRLRSWSGPVDPEFQGRLRFS